MAPACASEVEARIAEAIVRVDAGTLSDEALQTLLRMRTTPAQQAGVLALHARYLREQQRNPLASLQVTLPHLLGVEAYRAWLAATKARQERIETQQRDVQARARREQREVSTVLDRTSALAALPRCEEWQVQAATQVLAIEAARSLLAVGEIDAAMAVARMLGASSDDVTQILAAECQGDILLQAEDYPPAIAAFTWAKERATYCAEGGIGRAEDLRYLAKRCDGGRQRAQRLQKMPALAKWHVPASDEGRVALESIAVRLHRGTATKRDRDDVNAMAQRGPEAYRDQASVLAARFARLVDQDRRAALALLAGQVLSDAKAWDEVHRAHNKGDVSGADVGQDGFRFPPRSTWRPDAPWEAIVEVACCLSAEGDDATAIAVLTDVRSRVRTIGAAEVALALGEIAVLHGRPAQAVDLLAHAQSVAEHLRIDRQGRNTVEASGRVEDLIRRIAVTARRAQEQLESERFGPDFVAYRAAQQLRLERKDIPLALQAYAELRQQYPDTVYAQAATAYRIACLVELAGEGAAVALRARQAELEQQATGTAGAGRADAVLPRAGTETAQDAARRIEAVLERTPTGSAAWSAAIAEAEAALRSQPNGLYRGEMLLRLGIAAAEDHGRLGEAAQLLQRCRLWIENVERIEEALAHCRVAEAAQQVTEPPQERRVTDRMSNQVRVEPAVEHVVNRLTAPWYMEDLHCRCLLYAGMVAYLQGDYKEAELCFGELRLIDSHGRQQEEKGFWSTARRMLWNVKHNRGGCYGTAGELAGFKDPAIRIRVFLADMQLEAQDYPAALSRFGEIRERHWQRLGTDARAYLLFAIAVSLGMQNQNREAFEMLGDIDVNYSSSAIHPRALLTRANWCIGGGGPGSEQEQKGLAYFDELRRRYPQTQEGESAAYHLGWVHCINGRPALARPALLAYLFAYPNGRYRDAARSYLASLDIQP